MTDHNKLHELKKSAKRLARATRVPHHEALDTIANLCGLQHWNNLTTAYSNGWRPSPEHEKEVQILIESNVERQMPIEFEESHHGEINGHPYKLTLGFDDVLIGGNGWCIHLGHAPSESPTIEKYTNCAIDDPAILAIALKIANEAADWVRSRISSDWPRRSTKADAEGRVVHPLWANSELSSQWFCLHCGGTLTGKQMAENMWHCPKCSATPLDIFATAFWKDAS
jgi:hypothetical protein